MKQLHLDALPRQALRLPPREDHGASLRLSRNHKQRPSSETPFPRRRDRREHRPPQQLPPRQPARRMRHQQFSHTRDPPRPSLPRACDDRSASAPPAAAPDRFRPRAHAPAPRRHLRPRPTAAPPPETRAARCAHALLASPPRTHRSRCCSDSDTAAPPGSRRPPHRSNARKNRNPARKETLRDNRPAAVASAKHRRAVHERIPMPQRLANRRALFGQTRGPQRTPVIPMRPGIACRTKRCPDAHAETPPAAPDVPARSSHPHPAAR